MQANTSKSLPLVSILINNHNYGHFLADAIDSALSQTYSHIEVIVVDNGSTDRSSEVIAKYGDKVIPVFREKGGQSVAFNVGFAASQGEVICFLDADDVYLPEKVAEVVQVLKRNPESQWCFHMLQRVATDLKTSLSSEYDDQDSGLVFDCDLRMNMHQGGVRGKTPFPIPATSGLCFTRSLLQQILPMPEAESIVLNDSYLQFSAFALAKGSALAKKLSLQRVHGNNSFTQSENTNSKMEITAKIHCFTAYSLRANFPFLSKFSDNFFAVGLNTYWRIATKNEAIEEMIEKYFASTSYIRRTFVYLKACYYYFKASI